MGASLWVRLFAQDGSLQIVQDHWLAPDGSLEIVQNHPPVVVRKTSCCLVAENDSDSDSE
jgi:hypothetical protein